MTGKKAEIGASTIPAHKPPASEAIKAIQAGNLQALAHLTGEHPELASTRGLRQNGHTLTLLHVATDWPGHFPNGPKTVAALIEAGADASDGWVSDDPRCGGTRWGALRRRLRRLRVSDKRRHPVGDPRSSGRCPSICSRASARSTGSARSPSTRSATPWSARQRVRSACPRRSTWRQRPTRASRSSSRWFRASVTFTRRQAQYLRRSRPARAERRRFQAGSRSDSGSARMMAWRLGSASTVRSAVASASKRRWARPSRSRGAALRRRTGARLQVGWRRRAETRRGKPFTAVRRTPDHDQTRLFPPPRRTARPRACHLGQRVWRLRTQEQGREDEYEQRLLTMSSRGASPLRRWPSPSVG